MPIYFRGRWGRGFLWKKLGYRRGQTEHSVKVWPYKASQVRILPPAQEKGKFMGFNPERKELSAAIHNEEPVEIRGVNLAAERELKILSNLWGQVNAFGTNEIDEFKVKRENGRLQGIFKCWAVPVIPFQLAGRLDLLASLLPEISQRAARGQTFETALNELSQKTPKAIEAQEILENWCNQSLEHPIAFSQQLEKARTDSWLIDQRLAVIFNEEPLSEETSQRISQLVNRLTLALGLLSPFYNLEALSDDSKGFKWNPVRKAQEKNDSILPQDCLDFQAMLLPAAFKDQIIAEKLDWHDLSWEKITSFAQDILSRESEERQVLLRLVKRLGILPSHFLFSLNVLEFIPACVGGKKADFTKEEALKRLKSINTGNTPSNKSSVLLNETGKINAKIRFLNWVPLIEGEGNFQGRNWTYASLCDTSALLRETLINHPEVWQDGFDDIFINHLAPQIERLDAESAKARFLLHLVFVENRLKSEFIPPRNQSWQDMVIKKLCLAKQNECFHVLGEGMKPLIILGGKVFGLEFLFHSGEKFNIPPGIVLTSEGVEIFLRSNQELWGKILQADTEDNPDKKSALALEIKGLINKLRLPDKFLKKLQEEILMLGFPQEQKFAVRSSSFDEDNPDLPIFCSAGIQKSILNVDLKTLESAIKQCISSFFDEKAISFRRMNGLSDMPIFALLIQPMINGIGGVAFSKDLQSESGKCTIDVAQKPWMITERQKEEENEFTEFVLNDEELKVICGNPQMISPEKLREVKSTLKKIEGLTNEEIDLEWAINKDGKIWVLQARVLPTRKIITQEKIALSQIILKPEQSLTVLDELFRLTTNNVRIVIKGNFNLDAFQAELFKFLIMHENRIAEISLDKPIPLTSHFCNICGALGIKISF